MRLSSEYFLYHPISQKLFGAPDKFTFRQRFFLFASFFASLNMFFANTIGYGMFCTIINISGGVIVFLLYLLSRFFLYRNQLNSFILFITTIVVLSVNWFFSEGMNGSNSLAFLTIVSFIFFLFEGKAKIYMTLLLLTNVLVLILIEYLRPDWILAYNSIEQSIVDHLVAFIMSIPLIAISVTYAQQLYKNEKISNVKIIDEYFGAKCTTISLQSVQLISEQSVQLFDV